MYSHIVTIKLPFKAIQSGIVCVTLFFKFLNHVSFCSVNGDTEELGYIILSKAHV